MKLAHIISGIVYNMSIPAVDYQVKDGEVLVPLDSPVGIGWSYLGGEDFNPPTPTQVSVPDPEPAIDTSKLIDIGPFFDRFDHFIVGTKLSILAHQDAVVQAIVKDVQSRKWITLDRLDVAQAIDILISKNIPNMTLALKDHIINSPVQPEENLALRKLYFS